MKIATAQKNDDAQTSLAHCQYHAESVMFRRSLQSIENVLPNENSASAKGFDFEAIRSFVRRQKKLPKNENN